MHPFFRIDYEVGYCLILKLILWYTILKLKFVLLMYASLSLSPDSFIQYLHPI